MTVLLKPTMVLTPTEIHYGVNILIDTDTGKILTVSEEEIEADQIIEFSSPVIAVPGLINVHDHLLGTYWPKVGRGPHLHWKFWDDELKSSRLYKERSNIPKEDIYLLGAYKNLLSGVTTVMDHFPHKFNENILPNLPINVPSEYCLAHEVSSFELSWWGEGVEVEYKKAVENNWPFVTHIEEGFDEESRKGIEQLEEKNALGKNAVLVHGLALSDEDIEKIAKAKAHLVWCPNSNMHMFDTCGRVKEWLDADINVSLGTDSPMSGSINLFAEMRFAYEIYQSIYGKKLDEKKLVEMVTINPAKALRIADKKGQIKTGFDADITLLSLEDFENPYANIRKSETKNIEGVFIKGKPVFYKEKYNEDFQNLTQEKLSKVKLMEEEFFIKGDLNALMKRIYFNVGFKKLLPFIPLS